MPKLLGEVEKEMERGGIFQRILPISEVSTLPRLLYRLSAQIFNYKSSEYTARPNLRHLADMNAWACRLPRGLRLTSVPRSGEVLSHTKHQICDVIKKPSRLLGL